jgi:hypothetical protein
MTDDETDDLAFQIESRLVSQGVYVTELDEQDGTYRVTYESLAADKGAIPHREIGRVINVVRDLHSDDWEGADIAGTVLDLDGETRGTWHCEADWIDELHNGDLSETEFSGKVIETVET